jgi:putative flavoprotein involved in K+ transport
MTPPWLQLPVFDEQGEPKQVRGVVPDEPGLYFVGPHFLYAASSTMIHGIGRDASRVAEVIARRIAGAAVA